MIQSTKNRLYSASSLFQNNIEKADSSNIDNILSPEEDQAIDLMELGLSYINNGSRIKCHNSIDLFLLWQ